LRPLLAAAAPEAPPTTTTTTTAAAAAAARRRPKKCVVFYEKRGISGQKVECIIIYYVATIFLFHVSCFLFAYLGYRMQVHLRMPRQKGGRVGRFFEIFDHPTLTGPGRFKKSQGELKAAFLREKVAYRGIYTQYLAR
jgi:hypothetical protein